METTTKKKPLPDTFSTLAKSIAELIFAIDQEKIQESVKEKSKGVDN